jgi:hypothetical protein
MFSNNDDHHRVAAQKSHHVKRRRPATSVHGFVLDVSAFGSDTVVNYCTFNLDFESGMQQRRAIRTEKLTIIWAKILQKSASF